MAAKIIRTAGRITVRFEGRHVAKQLVRSGTAPGAHYEEARRAKRRADFVHKLKLAAKECGESLYWLRLARRSGVLRGDVSALLQDGTELTAILVASVKGFRLRLCNFPAPSSPLPAMKLIP